MLNRFNDVSAIRLLEAFRLVVSCCEAGETRKNEQNDGQNLHDVSIELSAPSRRTRQECKVDLCVSVAVE